MEFRHNAVLFQSLRGSGPRNQSFTEVFARNVLQATAGLASYSVGFGNRNDRPFGELQIEATTSINLNAVEVNVTFGLRDWSGEWDNEYLGIIEVVVLAELSAAGAAPVRQDLQITGMELTQAIQFFRSEQHLDLHNVRPDNSIPLVANKPTVVRVYVDYDASLGLPAITLLSGELEVITQTGLILRTPNTTITPRRDTEIDRGQSSHTLIFPVDAAHCRGAVQFRCRVYDAADFTQVSAYFSKNGNFNDIDAVRLFVVGVNFTGQGMDLAAPTLADFLPDLEFTERIFPIPEVRITGYTTIDDFSEDMEKEHPECGPGFAALLSLLRDLKGDSKDIYYGVLPDPTLGIKHAWAGCGNGNSRVASAFLSFVNTHAHEIGHAMGRPHVPCDDPGRCGNPADPDPNYPRYGNYPSDSIGEFGYDSDANILLSPQNNYDIMGYSRHQWVSPYTYLALMQQSSFSSQSASSDRRLSGPLNLTKTNVLFLDLTIDRQRRVIRRASFHYPALPYGHKGKATAFSVEFLDECRRTLACFTLHEDIQCGCCQQCWPRKFTPELPMPLNARWFLVWEENKLLYEECLPPPPRVTVDCHYDRRRQLFEINWTASDVDGARTEPKEDFWYLIQWQDVDGTWRGLMPRTQQRAALVAPRLFGRRKVMKLRVLASSGVATGLGECLLRLPSPISSPVSIVLTSHSGRVDDPEGPVPVPITRGTVRVHAFDDAGRSISNAGFVWFNEAGREIGRGNRVTLREAGGTRSMTVIATNYLSRSGTPTGTWLIERDQKTLRFKPLDAAQPDSPSQSEDY